MRIARLMGIDIYLNVFFLGLLGLFFVAGVMGKGLLAFAVVFFHELAHAAVARRLAVPVAEVELFPFGGVTRMGSEMILDPVKESYIAVAGPASNLLMAAVGLALKNHGLWHDQLGPFFLQCNLLIAVFNLLPALPLDGGRVYRAYLASKIGIRDATYRAAGLGQIWAALIVLFGAFGLFFHFSGLDILFTGLFLFYAATREKGTAPYLFARHLTQKKEDLRKARVLPAEPLVVMENVTLGEITRPFLPQRFHLVLVLDRRWRYKGMLTETQIIDGLLEYGFDLPVGRLLL
ncbi:MAG: site-2 protease family protein [Armatimonadetes bacterium]|nr:site-2 protease family protein [Armatimonadota bacterium]